MNRLLRFLVLIILGTAAPASQASFHLITIEEIYSNADGSVQYIVLHGNFDGQNLLKTHSIQTNGPGGPQTYTFPTNLPNPFTNGHRILIATQGFAALNLVTPDYVVPNDFVPTANGTVNYAGVDQWTYTALPTDGVNALYAVNTVNTNFATNFAGASGAVVLPTKLAITSVNGGVNPAVGVPFNVVVQAQDSTNSARSVAVDTAVSLSLQSGTGVLSGTPGCLIAAGSSGCTVAGAVYSLVETGVIIAASSGGALAPGNSAPFDVTPPGPTPIFMKSGSRKVHDVAGPFDLPL
jgi:hypothetical protein